jgi:hypothetical protein
MASKRGRKKARQKKKKAAPATLPSLTPPPPHGPLLTPTPTEPPGPSGFWQTFHLPPNWRRWGWGLVLVLTTAITLLEGYPWLSVVGRSTPMYSATPFSTLFDVTNDGYLPATSLDAVCMPYFSQVENFGREYRNFANRLLHSQRATLPCFHMIYLARGTSGDFGFKIRVTYYVWPFTCKICRRSQTFAFKGMLDSGGGVQWMSVN